MRRKPYSVDIIVKKQILRWHNIAIDIVFQFSQINVNWEAISLKWVPRKRIVREKNKVIIIKHRVTSRYFNCNMISLSHQCINTLKFIESNFQSVKPYQNNYSDTTSPWSEIVWILNTNIIEINSNFERVSYAIKNISCFISIFILTIINYSFLRVFLVVNLYLMRYHTVNWCIIEKKRHIEINFLEETPSFVEWDSRIQSMYPTKIGPLFKFKLASSFKITILR